MAYNKFIDGITDKELTVEVFEEVDDKGRVYQYCPRCNHKKTKMINKVQYCINCGQHIAPKVNGDNKEIIKKSFLNSISLEELEEL